MGSFRHFFTTGVEHSSTVTWCLRRRFVLRGEREITREEETVSKFRIPNHFPLEEIKTPFHFPAIWPEIQLLLLLLLLFTAIGLSPGGNGCLHVHKHEKHEKQLAVLGTISAFAYRETQGNQEQPVPRWPVAGPTGYWRLASSSARKVNGTSECECYCRLAVVTAQALTNDLINSVTYVRRQKLISTKDTKLSLIP